MDSVTGKLADFVSGVEFEDLPGAAIIESKRLLLDSLGCALAGNLVDKGRISVELARRLAGPPESTIVGVGGKVSSPAAAFANGELIQALDYDSLLEPPPGHISPLVISAPLSLAEYTGVSGKELLVAMAVAHEVASRLALAMTGGMETPKTGSKVVAHRPAYTVHIFGGAAASARVLKFDADKTARALGLAGYMCPVGVRYKWAYTPPPTMVKHAPAGWMSQAEVTAVLLADAGYTGDPTVLDGEHGFWTFVNSSIWKPEVLVGKLGEEWKFPHTVRYKRFPCCGLMSINALPMFIDIIESERLMPEEIEKVNLWLSPLGLDPIRVNRDIRDHVSAQFSIPYPFAVAAHRIPVGADWQSPSTFKDKRILDFMKRIEVAPHPYFSEQRSADQVRTPHMVGAVDVVARGRTFRRETIISKDKPQAVMNDDELTVKFRNNASRILGRDKIDRAVRRIFDLENLQDTRDLLADLVP